VTDKLNLLLGNSSFHINRSFQGFLVINFFQNTTEVQYSLASYYSLLEGAFQRQTITKKFHWWKQKRECWQKTTT